MDPINVYFDYTSPFAYIASEVLPRVADRAGIALRWKPIDLMKLSNYADGLPYSPVKRRYVAIDAMRSAEFHGVPIRIPKPHPFQSATALRLAVVALGDPRFLDLHRSLFRAAWCDQRDLSSPEILSDCITKAKASVDEWLSPAHLPDTTKRLDTFTAEAEAEGVFGVPSMLLGGELFWGLDSLPALEWRLEHVKEVARRRDIE